MNIGVERSFSRLDGEYGLLKNVDTFHWLAHSKTEVGKFHGEFSELVIPVGLGIEIERLHGFGKKFVDLGQCGLTILDVGTDQTEVNLRIALH